MMLRRPLPLALLVLALALPQAAGSATSPVDDTTLEPDAGTTKDFRRACATPDPTPEDMQKVRAAVGKWLERYGTEAAVGGRIKVAFHVIQTSREGSVSDAAIQAQIAELNRNYGGNPGGAVTGYTFELASVSRTNSSKWFKMTPGSAAESQAKNALAVDPAHHLNIYTCKPGQNLLGWAYFPWSAAENNKIHGVVVHYASLPGGALSRFNLGRTATHEVGHYLGLYHTFQGGCTAPGDEVADTPFEATPTSGCPIGKDTCPATGVDPIRNYMDYSDDACYDQFTAGQDARMDALVPTYRPSLLNAAAGEVITASAGDVAPVLVTEGLAFRSIAPNPFQRETTIRFHVPARGHVSLRVYDVAGRLVETVVDGELPAGEQFAVFRGAGLPSGTYFASLRVGAERAHRSLVLLP